MRLGDKIILWVPNLFWIPEISKLPEFTSKNNIDTVIMFVVSGKLL